VEARVRVAARLVAALAGEPSAAPWPGVVLPPLAGSPPPARAALSPIPMPQPLLGYTAQPGQEASDSQEPESSEEGPGLPEPLAQLAHSRRGAAEAAAAAQARQQGEAGRLRSMASRLAYPNISLAPPPPAAAAAGVAGEQSPGAAAAAAAAAMPPGHAPAWAAPFPELQEQLLAAAPLVEKLAAQGRLAAAGGSAAGVLQVCAPCCGPPAAAAACLLPRPEVALARGQLATLHACPGQKRPGVLTRPAPRGSRPAPRRCCKTSRPPPS
jgi:hypothetical protein